jgi:hypothetical protein
MRAINLCEYGPVHRAFEISKLLCQKLIEYFIGLLLPNRAVFLLSLARYFPLSQLSNLSTGIILDLYMTSDNLDYLWSD